MIDAPRGALTFWSPAILISFDSGLFHGLLLTLLGRKAISIVIEPEGALMCRSSTLIVLADSGSFRALLLTDLGS